MFRGSARKKSRQSPYFNGTNYLSRPVYQYGQGLEILDEMPRFIPKEEIADIVTYFNTQINTLKSENSDLLRLIIVNTNNISENSSNISQNVSSILTNQDNLEIVESYVYSQS